MVKSIIKLIKNIFSGEPFEQTLSFEFSIYDVVLVLGILAIILFKVF